MPQTKPLPPTKSLSKSKSSVVSKDLAASSKSTSKTKSVAKSKISTFPPAPALAKKSSATKVASTKKTSKAAGAAGAAGASKEALTDKASPAIGDFVRDMLSKTLLWSDERMPFEASVHDGSPRVAFVAGDNGSGKSYLVERLRSWVMLEAEYKSISVSIRERTGAGSNDFSGMRRVMMYGSEEMQSTGATSFGVVSRAFGNLLSWSQEQGLKTMLVLDEPEMGLSPAYAGAMGEFLANAFQQCESLPHAKLVVVTHSKELVSGFERASGGVAPTFVHMGSSMGLQKWYADKGLRTMQDLLDLQKLCVERRHAVADLEAWVKDQAQKDERSRLEKN